MSKLWSDYSADDTHNAVHRRLLEKRKRRLVEREYGIGSKMAAQWLETGRVEVSDDEIEGWCPHDERVRSGGRR